ncbi:hypothetical protein Y032_0334g2836 [Ancylostoma ceylanicum]|uniref:Uncharacterized protein n=1 Tax=Ancylostoma ceylanicum TaxID=53326 RepID=A0A016RZT9_9BILA|nr:hypothetical protein Y032_0334g2836 [Ancylostoma ceylanicum]
MPIEECFDSLMHPGQIDDRATVQRAEGRSWSKDGRTAQTAFDRAPPPAERLEPGAVEPIVGTHQSSVIPMICQYYATYYCGLYCVIRINY